MRILCVFGRYNYGDITRGESYEHGNFLPALKALGHSVEFFDSWDRTRYAGFADLNRDLVGMVNEWRPDLVLGVLLGYEIWLETLDLIRYELGVPVINWGTDDSWKYRSFSRFIARHVDVYATTSSSALEVLKSLGLENVVQSQWAASQASLREPVPTEKCTLPVSFVGSAYGRRPWWIEKLRSHGIQVECFGHGWPRGPIPSDAIRDIIRGSVISLNFSESSTPALLLGQRPGLQLKARVFEVPGAGGFLLTQNAPDLERYYRRDMELATFDNAEELVERVSFYLAHPQERDRIARAGFERTAREHTYETRFVSLLSHAASVVGHVHSHAARSPRKVVRQLADAEEAHRLQAWMKILRAALVWPCIALWGRRRGPRAARRILFELSWRFLGKTTYSARGLPGRLFYSER